MPSGPPAERAFNFFKMRLTKSGENFTSEITPALVLQVTFGSLLLSMVNCDWKYLDNNSALMRGSVVLLPLSSCNGPMLDLCLNFELAYLKNLPRFAALIMSSSRLAVNA